MSAVNPVAKMPTEVASAATAAPLAANEPKAPQAAAATPARRGRMPLDDAGKPLYVRTKAPDWLIRGFAMWCGLALFVVLWEVLAKTGGGRLPGPASTWDSAVQLFSDPFYRKGPNDQGIGWNILNSLGRVGIGFGMAAIIGIPLGF